MLFSDLCANQATVVQHVTSMATAPASGLLHFEPALGIEMVADCLRDINTVLQGELFSNFFAFS